MKSKYKLDMIVVTLIEVADGSPYWAEQNIGKISESA